MAVKTGFIFSRKNAAGDRLGIMHCGEYLDLGLKR
jgi:hypothetical protein